MNNGPAQFLVIYSILEGSFSMKNIISKTLGVSALALGSSLLTLNTHAAVIDIDGSSSIGSSGVTIEGLDLSNPGLITVINPKYGLNTGDYAPITTDTLFTLAGSLNLADVSTWSITGAAASIGTFNALELVIIDQSADFLNVFTRGLFTPGNLIGTQAGGCATGGNTCAITDTSIRWTFSKTGASVSGGGTLASPAVLLDQPTPVPTPGSLALMAFGVAGLAMKKRRRTAVSA